MQNLVYTLRNLNCSYNGRDVVLYIESLDIPANKVVFVIGPSGIGKSTLLETLGLMNNTLSSTSDGYLKYTSSSGENLDLMRVWSGKDRHLAKLRSGEFSFIFQDNNLMPGLSAGENICTKLLIQGNSMAKARQIALPYMNTLDLHEDLFDRKVFELSGGQRQRLAFLRAFLGNYHVLFGDEPTGNLDGQTASKLMFLLRQNVKHNANSSAIIVSHDQQLAAQFADMIIPILPRKDSENSDAKAGMIHKDNIVHKVGESWEKTSHAPIEDISDHLQSLTQGN